MAKVYRIAKRDYRTAVGVLRHPELYLASAVREAELLVENHDQGATFDSQQRRFRPATRSRRRRQDRA